MALRREDRQSHIGTLLAVQYRRLPMRDRLLRMVVRTEGGQFRSRTLRNVLLHYYDIEVGLHSYGQLLEPGFCDPRTVIGRYVSIGPGVRRFGAQHPLRSLSMHPYWYKARLGLAQRGDDVDRSSLYVG